MRRSNAVDPRGIRFAWVTMGLILLLSAALCGSLYAAEPPEVPMWSGQAITTTRVTSNTWGCAGGRTYSLRYATAFEGGSGDALTLIPVFWSLAAPASGPGSALDPSPAVSTSSNTSVTYTITEGASEPHGYMTITVPPGANNCQVVAATDGGTVTVDLYGNKSPNR